VVQTDVRDITHWIPATKRALDDGAQLRTLLEGELRDGVLERLEGQIVSGNGTAPNLRGITNTSGIQTQALGADSRSDAIHKAMTLARLSFYEPDAIVLHPSDAQDLFLEKDANGAYIYGPPSQPDRGAVWGIQVVISPAIAAGTGVVGQFRRGATLWIREGVQVSASDSHSDFFTRRMVAIMATMRAAFAVTRPAAFVTVTGI
jgi:HK97 family phage major capsid protein